MPAPARIVAVDYGTKRVGVALADPLRLFAQPYGTFSQDEALARLRTLHAEEGLAVVVVGWPLTEAGQEGAATQRVQQYINRLRKALPGGCFKGAGSDVYTGWFDEHLGEALSNRDALGIAGLIKTSLARIDEAQTARLDAASLLLDEEERKEELL